MQLPVQGKFEEAPGWALRPAWGQQYGRSDGGRPEWGQKYGRSQTAAALRPDSPWSRQNRSPQWGRQRMPEVRRYLRGLGGAIPSMMSEPDYAQAASDANYYFNVFFPRYSNQYWQQSKDFADAVIADLQSRGYELRNLTLACASSDCFPAMYGFVMVKDGRSMEASAGNPIRFNSPREEADFLDAAFGGSSSSPYWIGGPMSVSEGDIGTLIANTTVTSVVAGDPVSPQSCGALIVTASGPLKVIGGMLRGAAIGIRLTHLESGTSYPANGDIFWGGTLADRQNSLNPPSYATDSFLLTPLTNPGNYKVEVYLGYPPHVAGQLKGTYYLNVPQSKCTSSYYPSSNQTANTATTTQAANTATTTTYRRDVQLLAPDGYRAGGRFTLKVWGAPNQAVEIAAWQNSLSHGRTAYGTTDSSGYFEISGVWAPEHAGRWQEDIYVGGERVGRLDFEIAAPQQTKPAADTVVILPPANQPPQPGSGASVETPSDGTGSGSGDVEPSRQAGFPISTTVLLVGAAALVFLLGGKK
jgi:hypothetical protein